MSAQVQVQHTDGSITKLTVEEISEQLEQGKLQGGEFAWRHGMSEWLQLDDWDEFAAPPAPPAPPARPRQQLVIEDEEDVVSVVPDKSAMAAHSQKSLSKKKSTTRAKSLNARQIARVRRNNKLLFAAIDIVSSVHFVRAIFVLLVGSAILAQHWRDKMESFFMYLLIGGGSALVIASISAAVTMLRGGKFIASFPIWFFGWTVALIGIALLGAYG
ncbi:hypothetical protein Rhal01_00245 [Rubritalea halochordaticola]|uniref:GYF domain-containing protein n=1 Tax=Rubritalea halochordaticola TaxID=714537 RepID=A0ABP9UXM4_9BACT